MLFDGLMIIAMINRIGTSFPFVTIHSSFPGRPERRRLNHSADIEMHPCRRKDAKT